MFTTLVLAAHRIPEHQPTLTSFPTVLTQYPPSLPTISARHHCPPFLPTNCLCPPLLLTILDHHICPLSLLTITAHHSRLPPISTNIVHYHCPPFLTTILDYHPYPLSLSTVIAHCPDASKLMGATTNEPCVNILMHQHQLVRFQGFQS